MRQEQYNFSDSLKEMYRHRQKKMIHKKDPEFDWNKYVLWLVPDIYVQYEHLINAKIMVSTKDDQILPLDIQLNRPYCNKRITQISETLKDKRKRMFGIPLLFDTFEEMCAVKNICIEWYLLLPVSINRNELQIINTNYTVDFEFIDNRKIYTVTTKDFVNLGETVNDKYSLEFDCINILRSNLQEPDIAEWKEAIPDRIKELMGKNDDIVIYQMSRKEKLIPGEVADILCESSFGFTD